MAEYIEKLTPEQEQAFDTYKEKWTKIGMACGPLNFDKAKRAAIAAYKHANLEAPDLFLTARSPLEACRVALLTDIALDAIRTKRPVRADDSLNRNDVRHGRYAPLWPGIFAVLEQSSHAVPEWLTDTVFNRLQTLSTEEIRSELYEVLNAHAYGPHDAYWLASYNFFEEQCGLSFPQVHPLIELAQHCGWWVPFREFCILQDRATELHMDQDNTLHREDGPAILYGDGLAVYSWHGQVVPDKWIEGRETLTAQEVLAADNTEIRRAGCEIIGWDRVLDSLDAKVIDESIPLIGTLYEANLPDAGRSRFLKVKCGTGRNFVLPVPPDVKTALDANAWTYNIDRQKLLDLEVRT